MAGGMKGSLSPIRGNKEIEEVLAVFDIGASGAHTKVYGSGMSVARTAAGKYTITFTEWRPVLVDVRVQHWAQADASPLDCRPTDGSFTYSATSASVDYEAWSQGTTVANPAQTEIPDGDRVTISVRFLKTA